MSSDIVTLTLTHIYLDEIANKVSFSTIDESSVCLLLTLKNGTTRRAVITNDYLKSQIESSGFGNPKFTVGMFSQVFLTLYSPPDHDTSREWKLYQPDNNPLELRLEYTSYFCNFEIVINLE
jgi:hypothetical protein